MINKNINIFIGHIIGQVRFTIPAPSPQKRNSRFEILFVKTFILCFHYIASLFGPFRNDPSYFAAQWKRKCGWIDPSRFLFPFGTIRYYKDCLLRIHINFVIKSIDSCRKLRRGQHKTSRKIYIKLRSIVKNLALKKIKTKNILADSRK